MQIQCLSHFSPGGRGLPNWYSDGKPKIYRFTLVLTAKTPSEEFVLKSLCGTLVSSSAGLSKYLPFDDTPEDSEQYNNMVQRLQNDMFHGLPADLPETFEAFKQQVEDSERKPSPKG